jgi:hypothetical protein
MGFFLFGVQSVMDTIVSRCTTSYLLAGPACLQIDALLLMEELESKIS